LLLYVLFYPAVFANRLFGQNDEVAATTSWAEWKPIEQLPNDMASGLAPWARGAQIAVFREGRYQAPLHEFVIVETKSISGVSAYHPGLLSSHLKTSRVIGCAGVILVVLSCAWWLACGDH
jgi:hypothetical protein